MLEDVAPNWQVTHIDSEIGAHPPCWYVGGGAGERFL